MGPSVPKIYMTPACGFLNKSSQSESAVRTSFALLAGSALAALEGIKAILLYLVKGCYQY